MHFLIKYANDEYVVYELFGRTVTWAGEEIMQGTKEECDAILKLLTAVNTENT